MASHFSIDTHSLCVLVPYFGFLLSSCIGFGSGCKSCYGNNLDITDSARYFPEICTPSLRLILMMTR